MPAIPDSHANTPAALNPIDPRHYLLLLKWVFFQPSQLKRHLYRASSELYRAQDFVSFGKAIRLPAYRNMLAMSILLTISASILVSWGAASLLGIPYYLPRLAFVLFVGIASGMAGGVALGLAGSLALGVAGGMALGMAGGFTFSVLFDFAFRAVYFVEVGVPFGAILGAILGIAFGTTGIVAVGFAWGVAEGISEVVTVSAALGVALGTAFGGALSVVLSAGAGALVGLVFGAAFAVMGIAAGSRVFFYPLEWLLALILPRCYRQPFQRLQRHPLMWDEFAIWPLPGGVGLLRQCLAADFDGGLQLAAQIAANPYQRWVVQKALFTYLLEHADPLSMLYRLAQNPELEAYVRQPLIERQFRHCPSLRVVLLNELSQKFTDSTGGDHESSERIAWRLTLDRRSMQPNPLAGFSALLYSLFSNPQALPADLAQAFKAACQGLRAYPHGEEVANSFNSIMELVLAESVPQIAAVHRELRWVEALEGPALRPAALELIKALSDVSSGVEDYTDATNPGQKAAALNRAAGALNELEAYVREHIPPPERFLLVRVIASWASTIAQEQGRLGEAALREMSPALRRAAGIHERTSAIWQRPIKPFDNPYKVGDPVYPPLFVGRQDIFSRIGEVWSAKDNPDSIILYGHRRMGKSSILRNLSQVAPPGSVIVYVDMAGETSFVSSTADLLLGLADRIHAAVRRDYPQAGLPEPDPAAFATQSRAQIQLNRLFERVREALAEAPLILALDEFEGIERAVSEGKIGLEIFQFLRSKTQEPWITLVFGGLHTLDEMSRDYQQPFYGSYENIRVSYLSYPAAWRLITNPGPDFDLNFETEAVEHIIAETGGQPYLVQQVCRDALDHLNHELFDLDIERPAKITLADVQAVLGPDFFRRGTVYFDGVWAQAANPEQRRMLHVAAQRGQPWSLDELAAAAGLGAGALREHLRWAERHDILHEQGNPPCWAFCVPLMRRWISANAQEA